HTGQNFSETYETNGVIHLKIETGNRSFPESLFGLQYLSRIREHYDGLPELLIHFLLLYNLSMICRYETEWWNELFHFSSGDDLPFIETFLRLTAKKVPLMTVRYLRNLN